MFFLSPFGAVFGIESFQNESRHAWREKMKRFHVHIAVDNLQASIDFYTRMFGAEPAVRKEDYAKWMMDDPRVNFAISQRGRAAGLDHLGMQMESMEELDAATSHLKKVGLSVLEEGATTCCYAESDKGWVRDPNGIAWENFYTHGESTVYGKDTQMTDSSCCAPAAGGEQPLVALKPKAKACCG